MSLSFIMLYEYTYTCMNWQFKYVEVHSAWALNGKLRLGYCCGRQYGEPLECIYINFSVIWHSFSSCVCNQLAVCEIFAPGTSGVARILKLPGHRNCTLAKAARSGTDEITRSVEKKISLHFSVTRMGSHGTFAVSWRAWCCAELALFMLTLLHAPSTKFIH